MLSKLFMDTQPVSGKAKNHTYLQLSGFKYSALWSQHREWSSDFIPCHLQTVKNCKGSEILPFLQAN